VSAHFNSLGEARADSVVFLFRCPSGAAPPCLLPLDTRTVSPYNKINQNRRRIADEKRPQLNRFWPLKAEDESRNSILQAG